MRILCFSFFLISRINKPCCLGSQVSRIGRKTHAIQPVDTLTSHHTGYFSRWKKATSTKMSCKLYCIRAVGTQWSFLPPAHISSDRLRSLGNIDVRRVHMEVDGTFSSLLGNQQQSPNTRHDGEGKKARLIFRLHYRVLYSTAKDPLCKKMMIMTR